MLNRSRSGSRSPLDLDNPTTATTSTTPSTPRKRDRSPADSVASESKRANSQQPDDTAMSDHEGSLGASRLHIVDSVASSSSSSSSEATGSPPPPPAGGAGADDAPPAYDDEPPSFIPTTFSPINRPDGYAQMAIVKDLKTQPLVADETWFLVSRPWYRRWAAAVTGQADSKDDDPSLDINEIGPVDNTTLAGPDGKLRKPVQEGVDLEVVPEAVWRYFVDWYSVSGPTFARKVVQTSSDAHGSERIEYYPPEFSIFLLLPADSSVSVSIPTDPRPPRISVSSGDTIEDLSKQAAAALNLSRPTRLWRLPAPSDHLLADTEGDQPGAFIFPDKLNEDGVELISFAEPKTTLSDALLNEEHVGLAIEQQTEDGKWLVDAEALAAKRGAASEGNGAADAQPAAPLFSGGNSFFNSMEQRTNVLTPRYNNSSQRASPSAALAAKGVPIQVPSNQPQSNSLFSGITNALRSKSAGRAGQKGVTGLTNLGNTCFMNSALQCMSNTKELQEYFVSGVYKDELNPDNPLGMNGKVAEAFGELIERLWSSSSGGAIAPREFKQALSRFAPSFSGYGQQDSQELLAFLLDGVHEDLNRIKKKPATNAPDWEGGGDQELVDMAKVCWEQYRSRNDSVIVDLFQGQYRSTVVCPDCEKVSITFDPFMYVTTNLPNTKKWSGKVYLVPADTSRPRYSVELELPKSATIKSIKIALGSFQHVDAKNLIVAEEWKGKFWKAWHDEDSVVDITDNDNLIFFESTGPFPQPRPRHFGKQKPRPEVDPNAPIVIAVQHTVLQKKKAHRFSRDEPDVFGTPFVLTLSPAEASTQEGIYRALAKQYARVSKKGEELIAGASSVQFVSPAPPSTTLPPLPSTTQASRPAPESMEPPANYPLPDTPPPETNEIEVDQAAIDPTLVASSTTSSGDATPNEPVASTSRASSPHPPVAKPLFTMHVPKVTNREGRLPFQQNDWNHTQAILLSERASRVATPPRPVAAPSPAPEIDELVEVQMASPDPSTASPEVNYVPVPLVRTGDFLTADWDSAAHQWFFGDDQALWGELEAFVDPALLSSRAQKGQKRKTSIEDCLKEFTKEERLGEDDTWYCPRCKKHQQATKKVEIWKVPDVLVFALKRFSANRYSRDKIDDFVDFPIDGFDMEPFVEGDKVERRLAQEAGVSVEEPESLIYDLYAVDNHYGGLGGGHYTAYAKNPENERWYDFDDSRVTPIPDPANKIKTSAAYLLFYRRRTTRPIGAKSRALVDSAIQSRSASAANSDVEGSPSRPSSPGPSGLSTTFLPGSYSSFQSSSFDSDSDSNSFRPMMNLNESTDDLFGTSSVRPADDSDTEADVGSPPRLATLSWNDGDLEDDGPTVDVKLDEDNMSLE
ncbi:UCH-domain-containing protein [Meredithblackwellia eburnea MCA 4105]